MLIASVPVFLRLPVSVRAPPLPGSVVIVPALLSGPLNVTVVPHSLLLSVIAPWAETLTPAVVVRMALIEQVLATARVCVSDAPPIVNDFTLTVPVVLV